MPFKERKKEEIMERIRNFLWENRIRFEISLYSTAGALLSYTLGVADIPSIIPPSQASFIGWFGSFLICMSPSLLFAAIAVACSQFFVIIYSLACVTLLLVLSAEGGDGAVTAGFAGIALWIGGLRFYVSSGFKIPIVVINIVLTTFAFYEPVQEPGGIDLIKALWTESGTENPLAYMQSVLIAWGWIIFIAIVPLILPPWRTAREAIVREVLPKILMDNVRFLRFDMRKEEGDIDNGDSSLGEREKEFGELTYSLMKDVVLLTDGKLATLTVFEPIPRMVRPVASWVILKDLMLALQVMTLQTAGVVKYFHGPGKEGEEVAEMLEYCAGVLKGSVRGNFPMGVEMEDFGGWEDDSDEYLLKRNALRVREAVEKWTHSMGGCCSPVPEDVNIGYPTAFKLILIPWLMAWMGFYKSLFYDIPRYILTPSHYRRLFDWRGNTDWVKVVWVIKFTIGMTCLFIMRVYWEAYANFAVPTNDPPGSHFSGWETIAFTMAFTQTTEGTLKKGSLRLLGTCLGGFSGWLALTACTSTGENGEDDVNPFGIVAWLTVTFFFALLLPFEKGPRARLGMSPDYGYGVQLFILTQSVICLYAFNGTGTKDDLVANRVVANCIGIAMAVILAMIPPQNLAGNPRNGLVICDLQEEKIMNIFEVVKEFGDDPERDPRELFEEVKRKNGKLEREIHDLFAETNDFIKDASRLPILPIFKLDPKLKPTFGSLIVASAVLDNLVWGVVEFLSNPDNGKERRLFAPGTELRGGLEEVERKFLEREYERGEFGDHSRGLQMLVPYLDYLLWKLGSHREVLSEIRYGIFSMNYC